MPAKPRQRISDDKEIPVRVKKKEPEPKHDGLHMPDWSETGNCGCMCKKCWMPASQTKCGKCICPDCICGGAELNRMEFVGNRFL
jgi:hypothetical protein